MMSFVGLYGSLKFAVIPMSQKARILLSQKKLLRMHTVLYTVYHSQWPGYNIQAQKSIQANPSRKGIRLSLSNSAKSKLCDATQLGLTWIRHPVWLGYYACKYPLSLNHFCGPGARVEISSL